MRNERELKDWEGADSIDLRRLWSIIDRRKWAIVAFALATSLIAAVAVSLVTPMYQATSTVLVESKQANVISIEEVYGLDMRDKQYYDTQFAILRSRPIAEAVVRDLNLTERFAEQRRRANSGWLSKSMSTVRGWVAGGSGSTGDNQSGLAFQKTVEAYQGALEIEPVPGTQLVQIHFSSPDPELAAEIANAHASAYIESILDAKLEITKSASSWMAERSDDLRNRLVESEQRLQAFREQEGLIDAQGIQTLPTREINELTTDIVDARRRLSDARIAYEQVQAGTGDGDSARNLESVPGILSNPAVRSFREAEAEAEQQVAELAKRYGPRHPKMIAARSELESVSERVRRQENAVAASIEADYLAAQSDVNQLERELAAAKAGFQVIGRKQSQLSALQREVEVNRQLFDLFYNRMQETSQTNDLQTVYARIMSSAIAPMRPVSPNMQLVLGFTLLASLIFGVVVSFLEEGLNNTLRSFEDAEDKLGLPTLGMVPLLHGRSAENASGGAAYLSPETPEYSEAVRAVRTSITLDSLDVPHKVILITSAVSGEGKSSMAFNLACAFGQVEKTLLLDGDLRRPSIASAANISRGHPGLSDILAGRADVDECIVQDTDRNVDILATGMTPPHPLELLSSRSFADILKELQTRYDRIILDSPPLLPVSDPVILSRYADAVVLVVKAEATLAHRVRQALSKLETARAPVAGIVLNQLDMRKAQKYSHYGYGGYGENYTSDHGRGATVSELSKVRAEQDQESQGSNRDKAIRAV